MRRGIVIGAAAVLGAVCYGGIGLAIAATTGLILDAKKEAGDQVARDVTRIRPEKMAATAELAGLVLPPGCTWLDGYYYYWQEYSLCARFQVPAAGLTDFIARSGLEDAVPGLRPREIMSAHHPASKHDPQWRPSQPAKVSGVELERLGKVARSVMLDLDRPETVTVYLIASDSEVSIVPSASSVAEPGTK